METFFKNGGIALRTMGGIIKQFYSCIFRRVDRIVIPDFPMPYTVCRLNLAFEEKVSKNLYFSGPLTLEKFDDVKAEILQKPHESILDNPAQFCLPFYRSFYEIISEKQEAKEEVDKYLAEAKNAVKGSKSKKLLFEVVNNLANALKEVQNPENMDLEAKKSELNFYRKYCDRAAELLRDTEEKAPFATITMRKGLPILDRKLKSLIEEIKEKANTACQVSQGTPTREVAWSGP